MDERDEPGRRGGAVDPAEVEAVRRSLIDAGVPPERLVGATDASQMRDVLLEHRLLGDEATVSLRDLAGRLDTTVERVAEIWAAIGMPALDPDQPALIPQEVEALGAFAAAADLFGTEPLLRFTRVLGAALDRIAESAFTMFTREIEDPLRAGGGGQLALTEAAERSIAALGVVPDVMTALFRRQALHASRRLNAAHGDLPTHDTLLVTTGFADLVGSTAWTVGQGARDLARSLAEFDRLAQASLRGQARIVKTIGDEVMFVTVDPADGCRTALALAEAVAAAPDLPQLRVGLATGPTVALDGDYYGAEVNRAARLVKAAEPGAIVVSAAVAEAVADAEDLATEPLGALALAGFDAPEDAYALRRA